MNMLKLASALAFAGLLAPLAANAAGDGTITFNGNVLPQSCGVTAVNGSNSFTPITDGTTASGQYGGDATIVLPSVTTAQLNTTANTPVGTTSFALEINQCSGGSTATAYFSGANINTDDGNLNNTVSVGTNVELQLVDGTSGSAIKLDNSGSAATQGVSAVPIDDTGHAELPLEVQYISPNGAAKSGTVTSTVDYTMVYN